VTSSSADAVRRVGIRLAALAQDGLTYATNDYDVDRYRQLGQLAAELFSVLSCRSADEFAIKLGRDPGYATPKVDVRGVIFDAHERVLLLRERADGLWSLPGGWADPGDSPSAAVTREVLEEDRGVSCLAGSIVVLLIDTATPVIWIVVVTLVFGITLGTTAAANQTALYAQVPAEQIATAAGLLRSCGYLGSIASSAVIALVFHTTVDDHGLHVIAWILVGVSIIGLVALTADPITAPQRPFRRRKHLHADQL
jgi:ADP-ribose pyrophosphatase YjhB (NUDIX family)